MSSERRQHVRVRPAPGVPLTVLGEIDGERQPLQVLDASVGGLGLLRGSVLGTVQVGQVLALEVSFGGKIFALEAEVRHIGKFEHSACGVQFRDLTEEQTTAVRRYVADMLERGMSV
jgi:c-di-GMP-binding flagellar brake protein YcgR